MEIIKASEFGLEENKANDLKTGLDISIQERKLLIEEFETVKKLEITEENIQVFKALRLKFVKNRTQGIDKWHKAKKAFFLTGGRFVDAIKNSEYQVNESYEKVLNDSEKHFENIEKEKQEAKKIERAEILALYEIEEIPENLGTMTDSAWFFYEKGIKEDFKQKAELAAKAEKERIAAEKAEKERVEEIEKENKRLQKEAKEKERLAEIERKKQQEIIDAQKAEAAQQEKIKAGLAEKAENEREEKEKLEKELADRKEKEAKEAAEKETQKQALLQRGDVEKYKDLVNELKSINEKYSFESQRFVAMFKGVQKGLNEILSKITK